MPTIDVGELAVHYRREGPRSDTRPPIILIAGMASDSGSWQPVIPALSRHFDVIAPDNRCTGQTTPNPIANSRDAMLGDLAGLMDALELPTAHLVGHSMGAMLSWAFTARHPERVSSLVAISGLPEVMPVRVDFFRTMARMRAQCDPADWFRLLLHALFSPAFFTDRARVEAAVIGALGYAHRQTPEALEAQAGGLASFISSPEVARVQCPILAMTGELDMLTTPAMLHARYQDLPEVEQQIVAGAAHAIHWEQPDAVVSAIKTFLDSHA